MSKIVKNYWKKPKGKIQIALSKQKPQNPQMLILQWYKTEKKKLILKFENLEAENVGKFWLLND